MNKNVIDNQVKIERSINKLIRLKDQEMNYRLGYQILIYLLSSESFSKHHTLNEDEIIESLGLTQSEFLNAWSILALLFEDILIKRSGKILIEVQDKKGLYGLLTEMCQSSNIVKSSVFPLFPEQTVVGDKTYTIHDINHLHLGMDPGILDAFTKKIAELVKGVLVTFPFNPSEYPQKSKAVYGAVWVKGKWTILFAHLRGAKDTINQGVVDELLGRAEYLKKTELRSNMILVIFGNYSQSTALFEDAKGSFIRDEKKVSVIQIQPLLKLQNIYFVPTIILAYLLGLFDRYRSLYSRHCKENKLIDKYLDLYAAIYLPLLFRNRAIIGVEDVLAFHDDIIKTINNIPKDS